MGFVHMSGHHKWSDIRRGPPSKPSLLSVGANVIINAHQPNNTRELHICEAKIIRHPVYPGGPYKLMITGVRLNTKDQATRAGKLLGLKLLRQQKSINEKYPTGWGRQDTDTWVRLEEKQASTLVHRAVTNIRKEMLRRKIARR